MSLRYGENPHQKGTFHGNINSIFEKLHKIKNYHHYCIYELADDEISSEEEESSSESSESSQEIVTSEDESVSESE